MKATGFLMTQLAFMLLCMTAGCAWEIRREPLDQLWEKHMLAGTAGQYIDGKPERTDYIPNPFPAKSFEEAKGSPGSAWLSTRGIGVLDFHGWELLGLLRGGGWELTGGLLGKIELSTSILELYGKRVWQFYPGLVDNYFKKRETTYEFFLLKREQGGARAVVLKKWIIQPEDVKWFVPESVLKDPLGHDEQYRRQNETEDVRGFFRYYPDGQVAEVTIAGLTRPFVERIKVELK